MKNDSLYDVFHNRIMNTQAIEENHQEFIANVIADYVETLGSKGYYICEPVDRVYKELEDEISIMLQKTIYGFFSISSYKKYLRNY